MKTSSANLFSGNAEEVRSFMDTVLTTRSLTKRYGRRNVVDGVSLTVRRGDIYGFLGPNGAGKTTTLRMIVGLVRPTGGSVQLLGQDAAKAPRLLMSAVGSLIEGPAFYPHLSAAQNLELVRTLKGSVNKRQIPELLELVNLANTGNLAAERFSLGMKQRLGIAMALVGDPQLLVLDEPTNGLDPEGFREIRALLRLLVAERNMTILLSSHLLHEVEQVATRVGVIREGRLLTEASVDELRRKSERTLEVTVSRPQQAADLLRERLHLPVERLEGHTLVIKGKAPAAAVNALLVRNDLEVSRLVEREPSLEEIFFTLTEGRAEEDVVNA